MTGRGAVTRRSEKGVFAENAERNLVGNGFPGQIGAGAKQTRDRPGVGFGRRAARRPGRIAATGDMAGDVEQILGREVEPTERPAGHARFGRPRPGQEGVNRVVNHRQSHLP